MTKIIVAFRNSANATQSCLCTKGESEFQTTNQYDISRAGAWSMRSVYFYRLSSYSKHVSGFLMIFRINNFLTQYDIICLCNGDI